MSKYKLLFIFTFIALLPAITTPKSTYWDWRKIDICNVSFPKNFLWSTVQYSKEITPTRDNTTQYAWKKKTVTSNLPEQALSSGIQLAKELGFSGYAFSINWAALEPYRGVYDQTVLDTYKQICQSLHEHNMRPIVILKDHSDPLWFGYIGGFEKKENIAIFQNYCVKIIKEIAHTNPIIITLKSPEMYALNGYYLAKAAPGKKNIQLALKVLYHQLEAHTRIYHIIKKLPHRESLQIGITKYAQPIKPWNKINPLDHIACKIIHIFREKPFISWFTQGYMHINLPFIAKNIYHNKLATKSLDFIGIDTDSHIYMNNFRSVTNPHDIQTKINNSTLHPESLYEAIEYIHKQIASPLEIPIYITQSGIATNDETIRDLFFKRYLYALSKAITDGYEVKGFCYWSLFDGYSGTEHELPTGIIRYNHKHERTWTKSGTDYLLKTIAHFE